MSKIYWEVAININPICSDIVCDIIQSNFECEGIVTATEDYKDLELVKATYDIIKAYIVADTLDLDELKSFFALKKHEIEELKIFNEDLGSWNIVLTKQEIVDWSKKWKEHWHPSKISNNIVICPTWEKYDAKAGEAVVKLDPGNAFGTGTHPTTQHCVIAAEKYMPKNANIADIGCGSGILSICAIKNGAKSAVAIDNDKTVIPTAIENAQKNGIEDKIKFKTATIDKIQNIEFDFVMANILHNVLAEIMPDLKRITKKGAKISLSGILEGKEPVVLEAVKQANLKIIETSKIKEWIGIVVERED
ncbi:MAG: 50S ribosomal protein L11 methyltransferase [Candidatus Gastranaerophilales bacterium]|nr:50S ribosomal protein L11 methyltransferase [Candidatus Gastranaerophilales bacterium]